MRTIRNPRYAPEFLEKKLSPSSFVTGAVVELATVTSTSSAINSVDYGMAATEDPPLPPPYDPPIPPTPLPPLPPPIDPPFDPLDPPYATAA